MTLDEAIVHAKEVAKDKRREATYNFPSLGEYYDECKKCAREHEQLAVWLEELKEYRKHINLTEIPDQYKLGFQDGIVSGYNNGYNKAVDDLVNSVNHIGYVPVCVDCLTKHQIIEIAEKLRVEAK